ncbi:MAG: transporter [Rhodospirillales bacterium]|nr:transporter [Rhodospirillales bacterium]
MASGLAALLDDIAGIAKLAAASLDDVASAAGKAGSKAIGVVVDDAAVTPGYAVGFTPDRELPIVWKIAVGSLRNKLLILLPAALLLSALAPGAVTPLLMLGGAYLCFEAAEKIIESFAGHDDAGDPATLALSSAELEAKKVSGAIRTDLILSAEIMAIALADVADRPFAVRAGALLLVGLLLTVIVYGVVGLIVKMDDIGLHLARRGTSLRRALGRALVRAMPPTLRGLTIVGTAAMLWVGGGIIVHGLAHFDVRTIPDLLERAAHLAASVPAIGAVTGWVAFAAGAALVGWFVGASLVGLLHLLPRRKAA